MQNHSDAFRSFKIKKYFSFEVNIFRLSVIEQFMMQILLQNVKSCKYLDG